MGSPTGIEAVLASLVGRYEEVKSPLDLNRLINDLITEITDAPKRSVKAKQIFTLELYTNLNKTARYLAHYSPQEGKGPTGYGIGPSFEPVLNFCKFLQAIIPEHLAKIKKEHEIVTDAQRLALSKAVATSQSKSKRKSLAE